MHSYFEIAGTLSGHLHVVQPPIAVCLAEAVPSGIDMWSGQSPAGCRFWQEAAERVFATTAADHRFCAIGQYTHNLAEFHPIPTWSCYSSSPASSYSR